MSKEHLDPWKVEGTVTLWAADVEDALSKLRTKFPLLTKEDVSFMSCSRPE